MSRVPPRLCRAHEAKPCPFCGTAPTIQSWHGGAVTKRLVHCTADRCAVQPQVSGETAGFALRAWNRRAPLTVTP